MIDPGIFKAYDIRGTVPEQMTEEVAYRVGRALVLFLDVPNGRRRARYARVVADAGRRL